MIRNTTVEETKRKLFGLIAEQLDLLVAEIERVITASVTVGKIG